MSGRYSLIRKLYWALTGLITGIWLGSLFVLEWLIISFDRFQAHYKPILTIFLISSVWVILYAVGFIVETTYDGSRTTSS